MMYNICINHYKDIIMFRSKKEDFGKNTYLYTLENDKGLKIKLAEGLDKTIEYFDKKLKGVI